MYDFQETEFHRGGYVKSNNSKEGFLKMELLKSFSSEIKKLRKEINTMEGKYILLLAYYERLVEKNPDFLKSTSEVS